jgi:hypothetical protein
MPEVEKREFRTERKGADNAAPSLFIAACQGKTGREGGQRPRVGRVQFGHPLAHLDCSCDAIHLYVEADQLPDRIHPIRLGLQGLFEVKNADVDTARSRRRCA